TVEGTPVAHLGRSWFFVIVRFIRLAEIFSTVDKPNTRGVTSIDTPDYKISRATDRKGFDKMV
ncbi:MAG TPA: hypothetical protein VN281_03255, partial [Verrucomicrobiae bacterium]|nr:hypothetical protein [Verrucomicrobiae bacterium]